MHPDASLAVKRCSTCKQEKRIDEFNLKNKATGQRQSRCKACQRAASQAHYAQNKAEMVSRAVLRKQAQATMLRSVRDAALEGAVCEQCGSLDLLTFYANRDYEGPRVSAVIHNGMALATLEASMANSTVLCTPCMHMRQSRALDGFRFGDATREEKLKATPRVPKSVYKARRTRTANDLRRGREASVKC